MRTPLVCPGCHGEDKNCDMCNGSGSLTIEKRPAHYCPLCNRPFSRRSSALRHLLNNCHDESCHTCGTCAWDQKRDIPSTDILTGCTMKIQMPFCMNAECERYKCKSRPVTRFCPHWEEKDFDE